jgi:hypothetical protein
MKTFITTAALALTAFGAMAQEAMPAPDFTHFASTRTRAEVRNELQLALANGSEAPRGDASYAPEFARTTSTRSRAEVRAEAQAAIARGDRLWHGDASLVPASDRRPATELASSLSRLGTDEVR